ncbi:MAG: SGNH/GDSL hydrolase family protein [Ruminococcaceae bacterium]|nr:SGNH/GDSL hydrolase family protein [Oscillospiraceae bacterium]
MENNNRLYGKTILWNGDSICAGSEREGSWATRIAERNAMQYKNYAVGGGTVAESNVLRQTGKVRHSVSGTLDLMFEEYPNADYVILEGGTNDADLLGNAVFGDKPTKLGSFEKSDYSGNYDRNTFCGALESVFYRATKYWMDKKIGFIVAQKMAACGSAEYENRRIYFDRAVEICKKWGIPYIDLWNGCYLNPYLPYMYDATKPKEENHAENTGYYCDGQHLTKKGYDFTADLIETWLKKL